MKQSFETRGAVTAATSDPNYYFHLAFNNEQTTESESPTKQFKISNQNALLSLMSHDDLEGIKSKIHRKISQKP